MFGREVRKNLRGLKGIILLLLSIVGGSATSLLIVDFVQRKVEGASKVALHQAQAELLTQAYRDSAMGEYLADAPLPLLVMLNFCVWLAPGLIWLASFDTIAGEVQYRTVRYWTVRVRRESYYVGKFLGAWATVAVMTFCMHLVMWIVTLAKGSYSAADTISWGLRFWLVCLPIVGAWSGIALFVGSLFRTPISALLVVGFTFFGIFFVGAIVPALVAAARHNPEDSLARAISFLYPNSYDRLLLSPKAEQALAGLGACFLLAAIPTAGGVFFLRKRDV